MYRTIEMSIHFSLPTFMDKKTDKSSISAVKKHLKVLELQECALNFLDTFTEFDNLKNFSFETRYESNDEGGTYSYYSVKHFSLINDNQVLRYDLEDELYNFLNNFRGEIGESFLDKLTDTIITHDNIQSLVAKAMGDEAYKTWQEEKTIHNEKELLEKNVLANHSSEKNFKL